MLGRHHGPSVSKYQWIWASWAPAVQLLELKAWNKWMSSHRFYCRIKAIVLHNFPIRHTGGYTSDQVFQSCTANRFYHFILEACFDSAIQLDHKMSQGIRWVIPVESQPLSPKLATREAIQAEYTSLDTVWSTVLMLPTIHHYCIKNVAGTLPPSPFMSPLSINSFNPFLKGSSSSQNTSFCTFQNNSVNGRLAL